MTNGLQATSGLSSSDYEVLVSLTDVAEGHLRMSALADDIEWERSRLSHQVTRMEARGLVARTDCEEDGRGQFVEITPEGRKEIEKAAPHHVRLVRQLMIDQLTPTELRQMERSLGKILDAVDVAQDSP